MEAPDDVADPLWFLEYRIFGIKLNHSSLGPRVTLRLQSSSLSDPQQPQPPSLPNVDLRAQN